MKFHPGELKELGIASLAIAFAVSIATSPSLALLPYHFVLALIVITPAFVFHEMGHKYMAERVGLNSRFLLWETGLLISLILSLFHMLFLLPGAVYIYGGYPSKEDNGKISLAGPLVNILLAIIFGIMAITLPSFAPLFWLAARLNLHLAFFNLLPIPPLDGFKVIQWNFLIWSAVFFPVFALDFLL